MAEAENFRLHTSNRLEHLLAAWVRRLSAEPLPPFGREVVVVQSQGMRRWLTLELARRRGIAAGLWMPFPRDLARCLTDAALEGRLIYEGGRERAGEPPGPFDREVLLWRLYALLGRGEGGPGGALRVPAAYLAGDADGRKRFQLSARLAALFDDYQLFRGDWLRELAAGRPIFEAGDPRRETAAWQSWLWRQLLAGGEPAGEPLSSRLERAIESLRTAATPPLLPPRITVFGVSSLPPILLDLLRAAAEHIPVEIYFASPTWHYWGDLFSDREQLRLARRFRRRDAGAGSPPAALQHLERGHSLLSALGVQGRDFFNLLQEIDESGDNWQEVDFEDPGQGSVLRALQSDILHLVDRGSAGEPPLPLLPGELSLRVHVCHSPLREMEVLREELLHAFLEIPDLRPADVLVLLPEIESYAPLIDAVFGVAHEGAPELPYAVADRRLASTQKPAAALLALLDLAGRRLTVAEVFGLLESPALRRAAAIEENELSLLRSRVQEVGIRWGADGRQRSADFGLPLFEEASWQAGIDRLLFGYAVGPTEAISCGVAPAAGDGAGDTDLLGRFLDFLSRLFADLEGLAASRPAEEWSRHLIALVGRHLAAGDEDEELALQLLRDAFARLGEAQQLAGLGGRAGAPAEALPLEVIRQFLRRLLADDQRSGGFLSGGITFCALRPMRSIPFRVVAVAGLDDASFPRRDPPRAFDLLAASPRRGDRSPRLDDRYLFLETLLAARERLLLLYPGASQRDAAERAPSVVVAELLDLLDRSFLPAEGGKARDHLVVRHPLQAWSAANFAPGRPSSSRENAAAGRALAAPREQMPPFVPEGFRVAAGENGPSPPYPPLPADGERGENPKNEGLRPSGSHFLAGAGKGAFSSTFPGSEGHPEGNSSLMNSPPFPSSGRGAGGRGPGLQGETLELDLAELIEAFTSPSVYFCRRVLQLAAVRDEEEESETEPFGLTALPRFQLLEEMLERRLGGAEPDGADELALLRARFDLPPALLGEATYRRLRVEALTLLGRLPPGLRGPERRLPVEIAGADWLLRGGVPLRGTSLLRLRPGRVRPRDLFAGYTLGLAARVALMPELGPAAAPRNVVFGREGGFDLRPAAGAGQALAQLGELVAGFRELRRRPLPIFENASFAFAEERLRQRDPRQARQAGGELEAARRAFAGAGRGPGRPGGRGDQDAATRLLWRGRDPLAESDFGSWASRVFLPVLAARREIQG